MKRIDFSTHNTFDIEIEQYDQGAVSETPEEFSALTNTCYIRFLWICSSFSYKLARVSFLIFLRYHLLAFKSIKHRISGNEHGVRK